MMSVSTIFTTIHTCHSIYSSLLVILGYTSDASSSLLFSLKAMSAWLILPGSCNLHWPCDSRRATANSLTWDCLSRCKETQGLDLSWSMGSMWHWRKVSQALETSTYPETYPETGNPSVKFLEQTRIRNDLRTNDPYGSEAKTSQIAWAAYFQIQPNRLAIAPRSPTLHIHRWRFVPDFAHVEACSEDNKGRNQCNNIQSKCNQDSYCLYISWTKLSI